MRLLHGHVRSWKRTSISSKERRDGWQWERKEGMRGSYSRKELEDEAGTTARWMDDLSSLWCPVACALVNGREGMCLLLFFNVSSVFILPHLHLEQAFSLPRAKSDHVHPGDPSSGRKGRSDGRAKSRHWRVEGGNDRPTSCLASPPKSSHLTPPRVFSEF